MLSGLSKGHPFFVPHLPISHCFVKPDDITLVEKSGAFSIEVTMRKLRPSVFKQQNLYKQEGTVN